MQDQLPIHDVIPEIKETLARTNTVILQAPPGAGKSTVLPLHLLNESWLSGKKIIMLEPRRLAARAVAWRLAESLNEKPGETAGYRVRFESKISKQTRIEVVTEGILTRMLQEDNSLIDIGLVIFDEFHERSLHADLALALCRESQEVMRNDLRILIMSATLDGKILSELLNQAPVITSQGRQFPVICKYVEPDARQAIHQNTVRVINRALREENGDILAFLPGSGDIHRAASLLAESTTDVRVYCLYGDLPHEEQVKALSRDPKGVRKIILSTSIAETSLTIEGIQVVVDCGYSRVPKYDVKTGLTRLETVRVTADTAEQRAGRAGRLGPGVCYRIWPEGSHMNLVEHRSPEILEADLTSLVLELLNWGHKDPLSLTWMTTPPPAAIKQANQLLTSLGAIKEGNITATGRRLLNFPTHPRIAHLLLYGKEHKLSSLAADIAALLEERDPLLREEGTDISLRLEHLQRWRNHEKINADTSALERINRLSKQWQQILRCDMNKESIQHTEPGKLIAAAYPERIAKREGNGPRYRLANGRSARLPEHDPLNHEEWIAVAQLDAGMNEGKIFISAAFDPTEFIDEAIREDVIEWDGREGKLLMRTEWKIGSLIAAQKPLNKPNQEQIIKVLCDAIRKEGILLFEKSTFADSISARVMSIKLWNKNIDLPDLNEIFLLQHVEDWAPSFIHQVRRREDFKKIDLYSIFNSLLSWDQKQSIERLAPEKIKVPSGSLIALQYFEDGSPPVLAVRLQEVFGMLETPTINEGRVSVLMHLLSPGYRPVQVTKDLKSFWKNIYPEVRKELRVRYQKHSWPEDPMGAVPVRGAKKKRV